MNVHRALVKFYSGMVPLTSKKVQNSVWISSIGPKPFTVSMVIRMEATFGNKEKSLNFPYY